MQTAGIECMLADGRPLANHYSMEKRLCARYSSPSVIFLTFQLPTTFRT